MKFSKKLSKAMLMTLMCSALVPGMVSAAGEHNITDTSANPYVIPHFNDNHTSIDGTTIDSYLNISGNNDKTITLEKIGEWIAYRTMDMSGAGGSALVNSGNGTTTFNGHEFNVDIKATAPVTKGTGIDNSGKLVFDSDVYIFQDENSNKASSALINSGTLTFNKKVNINDPERNANPAINNSGIIKASGEDFYTSAIQNQASGQITIDSGIFQVGSNGTALDNKGDITINSEAVSISGKPDNSVPAIVNNGSLVIKNGDKSGYVYIRSGIENHGLVDIDTNAFGLKYNDETATDKTVINNYGSLAINTKDDSGIIGNIIHHPAAETFITLKGASPDYGYSHFNGQILGSDHNFSLTLENAVWEINNGQPEVVEGLKLNNGGIHIKPDNYTFLADNTPEYPWNSSYDTLKLKNLEATGYSWINISTDLKNEVGDQIELTGTTPEKLGLVIWNKDNNGGVPIAKEDGYSVRVVKAPSSSNLQIEGSLGFYNKYEDSFLYTPILETDVDGPEKYWNFVGWAQSPVEVPLNNVYREGIDTSLNNQELDTTFRRLNDLRNDPSEVGVWIRGEKGDTKIHDYSYQYSIMAGGYDWHKDSKAGKLFYGFGLTYSKNKCDDGVLGNAKSMGYNLYGSWLGKKNNDYVDVILKYGKLDKDFAGIDKNQVFVAGSYDKNLFSAALKYGRRYYNSNGSYYEPQVSYTYGKLSSADYMDNQQAKIHSNSINSHVTSVGMQVGKKVKGTDVYSRLSYVYDFGGKLQVSSGNLVEKDDMGGGYVRLALGAARKVNKNHSFYIDVEKDFGNKVKKPYAVALGYRYSF